MMILVYKKFRKLGIGRFLFEDLEKRLKKNAEEEKIKFIGLHVLIDNEPAIEFYKKMGFTIKNTRKNYYPNLPVSDAYLMVKDL